MPPLSFRHCSLCAGSSVLLSTFFVYTLRAGAFLLLRAQAVNLLCSSTRCPITRPQARARGAAARSLRFWFWPSLLSGRPGLLGSVVSYKTLSSRPRYRRNGHRSTSLRNVSCSIETDFSAAVQATLTWLASEAAPGQPWPARVATCCACAWSAFPDTGWIDGTALAGNAAYRRSPRLVISAR